MKSNYHILLVDDHPIITTAYHHALNEIEEQTNFKFIVHKAHTLDQALYRLQTFSKTRPLEILVVDLKLPPSKDISIISGEDFALRAKNLFPQLKIIIATTYNNNYRIHNIIQSVNPDGFLVKNDITPSLIIQAVIEVVENPPFYSKSIIQSLRKYVFNDFIIDKIDRQLLYQLSLGTKTKDLSSILPLSHPAVERRKKNLKEIFGIDSNKDQDLLKVARELGFI